MKHLFVILFILLSFSAYSQNVGDIHEKYEDYRARLLDSWIVTSENVEQFGVNIPAMESRVSNDDKNVRKWMGWSDENANFNHWLGMLSTEYRLLKNNGENYDETLKLLVYAMLSIERLDLYSEYLLRCHHGLVDPDSMNFADLVKYPDDINGFLVRDDVTLGFWKQYCAKFRCPYGELTKTKDGTSSYLSVFKKGVIPKQGMSQDNICYMMQGLALVKALVDNEPLNAVPMKFINPYIPDYLNSKQIFRNDSVFFDKWVDDIVDRLVRHMYHEYPESRIALKFSNSLRARPYKVSMGALQTSRWYVMNPVTNDLVAEGNGEDMGVWINSYGIAEAASVLTGKNYHADGSNYGLSKLIFNSVLFKDVRILGLGGFPLPDGIDDYMIRTLATIGDINRGGKNSTRLFYLIDDKRPKWTYEQNTLILYLLHSEKYSKIYYPGTKLYDEDEVFYRELLALVPDDNPSTDSTRANWSPYWSTASRMNWPNNKGKVFMNYPFEYCGLDFMFLYNLYRLVFAPSNYRISTVSQKSEKQYMVPEMAEDDIQYFYLPPTDSK